MDTNTKERIRIKLDSLRKMIMNSIPEVVLESGNLTPIDEQMVYDFTYVVEVMNSLKSDSIKREQLEKCNQLHEKYFIPPKPMTELWMVSPSDIIVTPFHGIIPLEDL